MLQAVKRITGKPDFSLAAVVCAVVLSSIGLSSPAMAQMNIEITGVGQSL